jgi:hypothetical protein
MSILSFCRVSGFYPTEIVNTPLTTALNVLLSPLTTVQYLAGRSFGEEVLKQCLDGRSLIGDITQTLTGILTKLEFFKNLANGYCYVFCWPNIVALQLNPTIALTIVAPLLEEWLKGKSIFHRFALPICEAYLQFPTIQLDLAPELLAVQAADPLLFWIGQFGGFVLSKLFFHNIVMNYNFPYWLRVLIHASFNFIICGGGSKLKFAVHPSTTSTVALGIMAAYLLYKNRSVILFPLRLWTPAKFLATLSFKFLYYMPRTTLVTLSATCCYFYYGGLEKIKVRLQSRLIDTFAVKIKNERLTCINFPIETTAKLANNHSHPEAARDRSTADKHIDSLIAHMGKKVFSISMSKGDQERHHAGQRLFYLQKDLTMDFQYDTPSFDSVIKLVDVDYYVDLNELAYGVPIIFYTFSPLAPAGSTNDFCWHTTGDEISMVVHNARPYIHKLWDYNEDTVALRRPYTLYTYFYNIDRIKTDSDHHCIIILSPYKYVFSLFTIGLARGPRRRSFGKGYLRHSRAHTAEGVQHYFSRPGDTYSAQISEALLGPVLTKLSQAPKPVQGDVTRFLRTMEPALKTCEMQGSVIFDGFLKDGNSMMELLPIIDQPPVSIRNPHYNAAGPIVSEDGQGGMSIICSPMMPGGTVPLRSYNNDCAMFEHRIHRVRDKFQKLPFEFVNIYIHEFVTLVLGDNAGSLIPLDLVEAEEHMARPTQRARQAIARAWYNVWDLVWSSFQKKESYDKIAPPRNITNPSTGQKTELGCFSYPFYEIIKNLDFCASGKNPKELTDMLQEFAWRVDDLGEGDITKTDGAYGYWCDFVNKMLMIEAFVLEYRSVLNKLLENETDATVFTAFGLRYSNGTGTPSGSMITALRTLIAMAWIFYCYFRWKGLSPAVAFGRIPPLSGDDNLPGWVDDDIVAHFKLFNFELKFKRRSHPTAPITFLGRTFVNLPHSRDCIADVPRQLRKLHLSANSDPLIPPLLKLARKAINFELNDFKTPILSNVSRAIFRCCRTEAIDLRTIGITSNMLASWDGRSRLTLEKPANDPDVSYWCFYDETFICEDVDEASVAVADMLGVDVATVQSISYMYDEVDTLECLNNTNLAVYSLLSHIEPKVQIEAIVDGNLLPADDGSSTIDSPIMPNNDDLPPPPLPRTFEKTLKQHEAVKQGRAPLKRFHDKRSNKNKSDKRPNPLKRGDENRK